LKVALERLLGEPCYHMTELFDRPDDVPQWERAARNQPADWDAVFGGFGAALDWPASLFYDDLMEAFPGAPVLLSTRGDADDWWSSMSATVVPAISRVVDTPPPLEKMIFDVLAARFTPEWSDPEAAKAAYRRHNQAVRDRVPPDRLVEWHPGDGWAPLCAAFGVDEPAEPFPMVNTTAEFRAMTGLDEGGEPPAS
jgi:sulfotransferase family protein